VSHFRTLLMPLRGVLLLVAAYVGMSLAMTWANPVAFGVPVWLPNGLAIACLYRRENAWPGVWLGSLFAVSAQLSKVLTGYSLLVATVPVAAGATLAAWSAAFALRVWVDPTARLETGRAALGYVIVAALSGVISAGTGFVSLWSLGLLSTRAPVEALFTWWIRDTLATSIGGAIIMTLVAADEPAWRARRLTLGVPLLILTAALGAGLGLASRLDLERSRLEFERSAAQAAATLERAFDSVIDQAEILNDFMTTVPTVTHAQFDDFAAKVYHRHAGIQAIEWVPRVTQDQVHALESSMQAEGYRDFKIFERTEEHEPGAVGVRSEYFPVTYVYPLKGNESALGFDLGSETIRRNVLGRAFSSHQLAMTGRLHLIQEPASQYGVLMVRPVFRSHVGAAEADLAGYTAIVVRVGQLAASAMEPLVGDTLAYRIEDPSAPRGETTLFEAGVPATEGGLAFRQRFQFKHAEWQIAIEPTAAYLQTHASALMPLIYFTELAFALLVVAFVLTLTGRTNRIAELVSERTAELEDARRAAVRAGNLLREAFDTLDQGFTIFDPSGHLVLSNRAYRRIYDKTESNIRPGVTLEEMVRAGAARGQYYIPDGKIDEWVEERIRRYQRADGVPFEQELADRRCFLIFEHRTPSGYVVTNRIDITQRRDIERALMRSEALLRASQVIAHTGSFESHLESYGVHWSEEMYSILGVDPSDGPETPQEYCRRFVHPDDQAKFIEAWWKLETKGGTFDIEYRLVRADGAKRVIHSVAQAVRRDDGRPEVITCTVHDVTERRQAEEEIRGSQEKLTHVGRLTTMGEMATGLAHEVNQPLTAIATYAQASLRLLDLPGGADPQDLRDALKQIVSQALRAGEVIRRLRSFVKNHTANTQIVPLRRVIDDLLLLAAPDARLNNVALKVEHAPEALEVRVDVVQIQQVLLNLIRNAIDAMATVTGREREILIRTQRLEDQVEVEVVDHGCGIPEEVAANLFTQFYTTKSTGTGLGLAISRTIIRAHHGQLAFRPTEGGGTTFYFTLPVTVVEADVAGA
jgi:two-component system, LuxR family, sensor kinase FixL